MDYTIATGMLDALLTEVAFKTDTSGKNVSIIGRSEAQLKAYLEENTSIPEDKKVQIYANFLSTVVTNVTTQAIQTSGQAPLEDAQIKNQTAETTANIKNIDSEITSRSLRDTLAQDETTQKILNLKEEVSASQARTKVALNDSAVTVAKAKIEIDQLIPAQIASMKAETSLKTAQQALETQQLAIAKQELLIKEQQLKTQTAQIELMQAQAQSEREKIGLISQQIRVQAAEAQYKLAQIKAIEKASEVNKQIEIMKNNTSIEIAGIYAGR